VYIALLGFWTIVDDVSKWVSMRIHRMYNPYIELDIIPTPIRDKTIVRGDLKFV